MLLSNVRPWVPLKGMDKLDMSRTCPGLVPDKSLDCPKSSIFGTSEKGRVQLRLRHWSTGIDGVAKRPMPSMGWQLPSLPWTRASGSEEERSPLLFRSGRRCKRDGVESGT